MVPVRFDWLRRHTTEVNVEQNRTLLDLLLFHIATHPIHIYISYPEENRIHFIRGPHLNTSPTMTDRQPIPTSLRLPTDQV